MADKEWVEYRGQRMIKGWPERIQAAQSEHTYSIGGYLRERVRYGREEEDWGADEHSCHDCRVIKDEFHVPGCDVERCPVCGDQAITCDCVHDDETEEPL